MTNQSINLLQPEGVSPVEKKRAFYLKVGTIFLIVFYCLIITATLSYGLVIRRESRIVADKIRLEKQKLADLQEVESFQFLLKQRLSSLEKVVNLNKLEPKYWLSYLESLVPEGVSLGNTQWNSNGQIKLSGKAENALIFSAFLDNLKEAADKQKIVKSVLDSASRQRGGTYLFSLMILVK